MSKKAPVTDDTLRAELDELARQLVRQAKVPVTSIRDRTNALKIAGGWWGISRKGKQLEEPANKWLEYRETQTLPAVNGEDADAETDEA